MIIILISPGITPVQNPYPYFTDEVTETPKVNGLPKAMQQLRQYQDFTLPLLLPWQWNNYASFQKRKMYCLYHRRLYNGPKRSHAICFKLVESFSYQQSSTMFSRLELLQCHKAPHIYFQQNQQSSMQIWRWLLEMGQTPICPSFEHRVNSVRYLILFIFSPRSIYVSSLPKCVSEHCSCVARSSFTYICSKNNVEYLSLGIKKKKNPATINLKTDGSDTV